MSEATVSPCNVPCRKRFAGGDHCSSGWMCDQCSEITHLRSRVTVMDGERQGRIDLITELRRHRDALLEALSGTADMFWDWEDTEHMIFALSDHVAEIDVEGVIYRIEQAVRLPDIYIQTEKRIDSVGEHMSYGGATKAEWDAQKERNGR